MKPYLATCSERVPVERAAAMLHVPVEDARKLPTYDHESDTVEVRWHLDRMEASA